MKTIVRIGTRGSKLALYQAYRVKEELEKQFKELGFEIAVIKTRGDIILDVPLSRIGDKGLFTKELEIALFNNEIDIAVHSLKDLPTVFPRGAKLGAVLKRGEIRDAIICSDNRKISDLTSSDVIATSSLRRKAQLHRINSNFKIVEIRGNVNTRIRKMQEGFCDVMVMAAAGLQRLGMDEYISELIDPEVMIPACSQGAIAIEIREYDPFIENILSEINDRDTWISTEAERAFLRSLEGGCQIPVGSYSKIAGDKFSITGFIAGLDGNPFYKDSATGDVSNAVRISTDLAKSLYNRGGKEILEKIRNVNLTEKISGLPLKNKIIISTRVVESGDTLPELLQAQGAKVLSLPMIEVNTSQLKTAETETLKNLDSFDWLFFSSRNGVVYFFKHLIEINGHTELTKALKIAAIGSKTALELEYYGFSANFISEGNTSEEMLTLFYKKKNPSELKILLALGNLADDTLFNNLSQDNHVQRINVYDTLKPKQADENILEIVKKNQYDLILFTSPSTFRNFCSFIEPVLLKKLKMASIGATTTKAITDAGFKPLVTAKKSNAEGFCESIVEFYK
ncbi:MAG: hydroxymethylbilane synthase [Bacteroidota bacterium]